MLPFFIFKKNFDPETASISAQILSKTTSWTFQKWSYHPEQDAECSEVTSWPFPVTNSSKGNYLSYTKDPPLLFLNIRLCMGLQLEHIGCFPKRLRLWGGPGLGVRSQVSIGSGVALVWLAAEEAEGAPVDRKIGDPCLSGCRQRPLHPSCRATSRPTEGNLSSLDDLQGHIRPTVGKLPHVPYFTSGGRGSGPFRLSLCDSQEIG